MAAITLIPGSTPGVTGKRSLFVFYGRVVLWVVVDYFVGRMIMR